MKNDLISRQAAIDAVNSLTYPSSLVDVKRKLVDLTSADAVEIVRCKDCKWFGDIGCAIKIVDETDKPHEHDFCSFAERRTDG